MSTSLRKVIENPNGHAFQERYVVLGRCQGKDRLKSDCRTLRISIPMKALETIEKGFSRKARISYNNDGTRWDYDMGSGGIGRDSMGLQQQKEKEKEKQKAQSRVEADTQQKEKQKAQAEAEAQQKEKAILEEKARRLKLREQKREKKKQTAWEKEKTKMSNLDSWEDL